MLWAGKITPWLQSQINHEQSETPKSVTPMDQ
jgi:hypothetical protein